MRSRPALTVLVATVLVLAACGDADDDASTTAAGGGTTTTEETLAGVVVDERDGDTATGAEESGTEDTVVVDERDGDTAAPADTGGEGGTAGGAGAGDGGSTTTAAPATTAAPETTPEPIGASLSECVVGTFLLDSAGFVAQIEDLGFDEAGGSATWEAGTYTTEFRADGTYTSSRAGWTIRLAAPEGSLVATFDGDQAGNWSVDDGTMDVAETSDQSTMAVAAEVDGVVVPLPGTPAGGGGASISGSGPVTCDDAGMAVEIDGIVTTFERIG